MKTKYKLYLADEEGELYEEFYTKRELVHFKIDKTEDISLFECAERMVHKFNRSLKEGESKRYAYKLERVTVTVLGSYPYYGLNISLSMCEPEFK